MDTAPPPDTQTVFIVVLVASVLYVLLGVMSCSYIVYIVLQRRREQARLSSSASVGDHFSPQRHAAARKSVTTLTSDGNVLERRRSRSRRRDSAPSSSAGDVRRVSRRVSSRRRRAQRREAKTQKLKAQLHSQDCKRAESQCVKRVVVTFKIERSLALRFRSRAASNGVIKADPHSSESGAEYDSASSSDSGGHSTAAHATEYLAPPSMLHPATTTADKESLNGSLVRASTDTPRHTRDDVQLSGAATQMATRPPPTFDDRVGSIGAGVRRLSRRRSMPKSLIDYAQTTAAQHLPRLRCFTPPANEAEVTATEDVLRRHSSTAQGSTLASLTSEGSNELFSWNETLEQTIFATLVRLLHC